MTEAGLTEAGLTEADWAAADLAVTVLLRGLVGFFAGGVVGGLWLVRRYRRLDKFATLLLTRGPK